MGNSSSSPEKTRKALETKVNHAGKTGILNLSGLELKISSPIWSRLSSDENLVTKIKVLTISRNDLKTIPVDIFDLSNIRKLHVSHCSLQRIEFIIRLQQLKHLDLDHNDLEEQSIALATGGFPPSITHLDMSFNHFSAFPYTLGTLTSITVMKMGNNRIQSTVGFHLLTSLEELELDDNLIPEVDDSLAGLVNLQRLSVKRNKIGPKAVSREGQSIPAALFLNEKFLRIDLEGNEALKKETVVAFEGVSEFLERRKKNRMKNHSSGAMIDISVFGLD